MSTFIHLPHLIGVSMSTRVGYIAVPANSPIAQHETPQVARSAADTLMRKVGQDVVIYAPIGVVRSISADTEEIKVTADHITNGEVP